MQTPPGHYLILVSNPLTGRSEYAWSDHPAIVVFAANEADAVRKVREIEPLLADADLTAIRCNVHG
jgi:hypothetical protein